MKFKSNLKLPIEFPTRISESFLDLAIAVLNNKKLNNISIEMKSFLYYRYILNPYYIPVKTKCYLRLAESSLWILIG